MKDISVREMMVPLAEYATVTKEATLREAIFSLEKAQDEYNKSQYRHRAILVYGDDDQIVGKLSQMDIIKALEPNYAHKLSDAHLSRFGIENSYIESILGEHDLWSRSLADLCNEAGRRKVADIMYVPTEGEYIRAETSLQEAIHRLVIGHHHSLLVTAGDKIIGVLRLTDVFTAICDEME